MITHSSSIAPIAVTVLGDLKTYLSVIEPAIYQAPLELLSGSSIGQHTRHIIEFYTCLLEQSHAGEETVINYANRKRDYRIESEPDHALHCVNIIIEKLVEINEEQYCRLDCSEHGNEGVLVISTVGRELIYNIEHTIHHLAIVKIALRQAMPSFVLPQTLKASTTS